MKFCQPHDDKIKEAVQTNGLWEFVAKDSNGTIKSFREEVDNKGDPVRPYDPLPTVHWMIINRLMEQTGPAVLYGDFCPLCNVDEFTKGCRCGIKSHADQWISGSVKSIRNEFVERGWIKPTSVN